MGCLLFGYTLWVAIFLIRNKNNLENPKFKDKYSALYIELRTDKIAGLFHPLIFLVRRLIFIALAITQTIHIWL